MPVPIPTTILNKQSRVMNEIPIMMKSSVRMAEGESINSANTKSLRQQLVREKESTEATKCFCLVCKTCDLRVLLASVTCVCALNDLIALFFLLLGCLLVCVGGGILQNLKKKKKRDNNTTPSYPRPLVVGHRGALYEELENTIPAFEKCLEWGCDMVELDVFLLKDGNLIVFHGGGTDQNPGDLTDYCVNQDGVSILDLTYQESQDLEWNPHYPELACPTSALGGHARIPLLREVLLALKDQKGHNREKKIKIKIELKGEGVTVPVLDLVQELGMVDQCQYSSFLHQRIGLVRKLHPETHPDGSHVYQTGALFDAIVDNDWVVEQAQRVGASEVHLRYDTCSAHLIDKIHDAQMDSMAWFRGPIGMDYDTRYTYDPEEVGNEDEAMFRAVMDSGVRQLCCNRPNVLVRYLDRLYESN